MGSADRHWQHESRPRIGIAVCQEHIRLRQFEYKIRFAELPPVRESRSGRKIGRRAFKGSIGNPLLDGLNLLIVEPALADELAEARLRQPGRHVVTESNCRDLPCMLAHIRIAEKTERSRAAGMMADGAIVEDDGRDIFIESYGRVQLWVRRELRLQNRRRGDFVWESPAWVN